MLRLLAGACAFILSSLHAEPASARFLQADPIGYEDQMNLYAYVGNDPLNLNDPSGECITSADGSSYGICPSVGWFSGSSDYDELLGYINLGLDNSAEMAALEDWLISNDRMLPVRFGGLSSKYHPSSWFGLGGPHVDITRGDTTYTSPGASREVIDSDDLVIDLTPEHMTLDEIIVHETGGHGFDHLVLGLPLPKRIYEDPQIAFENNRGMAPSWEARAMERTNRYRLARGRQWQRLSHDVCGNIPNTPTYVPVAGC